LKFYLPNFEDLVDPEYDFINDRPSSRRHDRFAHDWYAHQFFDEPIFDGVLLSKTVVKPSIETRIRKGGGVHAFMRLDPGVPVMGDCGAFSYRNEDKPPYGVDEILDYYQSLGFNYGVSIDHLIFSKMSTAEREHRLTITLENAQAFITGYQVRGCTFTPVGIAQGWDAASRRRAIERLLKMGYRHLALGGMARSPNKEILETLEAIKPILPPDVTLHIFGVTRLELIPDFIRLGVTSADSAAPLRRAFLGSNNDNYWTRGGRKYAAIRVPEVKRGGPKRRGVDSTDEVLQRNGVTLDKLKHMEQEALRLLRAYDAGQAGLEETLAAVLAYDQLHGDTRDLADTYRRTLQDRPWQQCDCPICRAIGIEVIIFRGNNRNRRRGFHNVKVFYEQFRKAVRKHIHK